MNEIIEFTVKCKMKQRWMPHFISMLKAMQSYGSMGCSRYVGIYSDGDGDFNPRFQCDLMDSPENIVKPVSDKNGDLTFDAG